MPGSEGNHSQTAEHRQYSISVVNYLLPSSEAVRHKCSEMHSSPPLKFTAAVAAFAGAGAAVLVFSTTDEGSFHAVKRWKDKVQEHS